MAQIFLCYAREDEARVRGLYDQLKRLGFELWMDKVNLIVGQRWRQEIPRALRLSSLVLVCLSENSVAKVGYVQREFKLALDTLQDMPEDLIYTLPVRLDGCTVPEQFSDLHWCNLFEENGFEQLVAGIRYGLEQRGEQIPEPQADNLQLPVMPARSSEPPHPLYVSPPTMSEVFGTQFTPKVFTNSIGMEFVLIPAGSFMMGSPDSDPDADGDEKPAHEVTISASFYMGKYEVTQAQWEAVMSSNPSRFGGHPSHPVEEVSWDEVQVFLQRLSAGDDGRTYALPSEAQWEYACRAGSSGAYYFGDDASQLGRYAWYVENSGRSTHPVGQKDPNAWGLYDMHGNVWEWVQDRFGPYTAKSVADPSGPDAGANRVSRGGGWIGPARDARSAYRVRFLPGARVGYLGFRCLSCVLPISLRESRFLMAYSHPY